MTGNTKKWTGLLLLFIAAMPVLIVTGFLVRQQYLQHEMAENLEKKHLHTVTAALNDVVWLKKNKEVEINGRLFDVKNFYISGNTITLTGLYGTEEEDIKKELASLLNQKKGNTPPLHQLVFKFLNTTAVNETNAAEVLNPQTKPTIFYHSYQDKIIQQYHTVVTPPPNI